MLKLTALVIQPVLLVESGEVRPSSYHSLPVITANIHNPGANIANIGPIPGDIGSILGKNGAIAGNIGSNLGDIGAITVNIGFIIGNIGWQNAVSHVMPGLRPAPIFSILAPINHLLAPARVAPISAA
jgi:hypothetical protein